MLPVDWSAYLLGTRPLEGSVSSVVVEKLSTNSIGSSILPDAERPFFHAVVDPIVNSLFWLDESIFRDLSFEKTVQEKERDADYIRTVTVFFIPLKENVRNLRSHNREEFTIAAFGVFAESILLIVPFVGKVAGLFGQSGKNIGPSEVRAILKLSMKTAVDAFNPLAGTQSLTRVSVAGGVKFYQYCERVLGKVSSLVNTNWVIYQGMAVLTRSERVLHSSRGAESYTVNNVRDVLVFRQPETNIFHLADPLTGMPYGPRLMGEELLGAGEGASAMLAKAGAELKLSTQGRTLAGGKHFVKLDDDDEDLEQSTPFYSN